MKSKTPVIEGKLGLGGVLRTLVPGLHSKEKLESLRGVLSIRVPSLDSKSAQ